MSDRALRSADDAPQRPARRRAFAALLALGLAATLAACGRKGDPEPPPDADPRVPRTYPTR
ncbi:MAG: lipoprotein [Rhodospirillales bacterium]|nr:lipoprotein [Rhodospirillales bacterium]